MMLACYQGFKHNDNAAESTLQKQIGYFNHRMVTLVAVKLWL